VSKVYCLNYGDGAKVAYYNTDREAREAQKAPGNPPLVSVDAAQECSTLNSLFVSTTAWKDDLEKALRGLVRITSQENLRDTPEGQDAIEVLTTLDPQFIKSLKLEDEPSLQGA